MMRPCKGVISPVIPIPTRPILAYEFRRDRDWAAQIGDCQVAGFGAPKGAVGKTQTMEQFSVIEWGKPVPWFHAATRTNPRFNFSSLGGRFILLAFLGHANGPKVRAFIDALAQQNLPRNDQQLVVFGVSNNKDALNDDVVATAFQDGRVFLDADGEIARSFGMARPSDKGLILTGGWCLIDPMLRVYSHGRLHQTEKLFRVISSLPLVKDHALEGQQLWAPVLMVPRVLHPEFCARLIKLYKEGQPNQSGFMREIDGRTVPVMDSSFKRRTDIMIKDKEARNALNYAVAHRLRPELMRAFQFNATRIERYIVSRYGAEDAGFFKRHRDNTTSGTAHRRFAVSINLNAEDHEGGELRFPEFGMRSYKPPTGGAVVFSCSLLHEATPVTKGERFATLPFLYDDEAAKIRQQNKDKIDTEMLVVDGQTA